MDFVRDHYLTRFANVALKHLPERVKQDSKKLLKARELFLSILTIVVFLFAYAIYFYCIDLEASMMASISALILCAGILFFQIRIGHSAMIGNLVTLLGFLAIIVSVCETNVFNSLTIFWVIAPSIYNIIYVGRKSGRAWVAISLMGIIILFFVRQTVPNLFPTPEMSITFNFLQTLGLSSFILLLFYISETERRIFHKRLAIAAEELRKKNVEHEDINRSNNRLISIISHDIRGPLRNAVALLTLSDQGAVSVEERLFFFNELRRSLEGAGTVIDNLLTWSVAQRETTLQAKKKKFFLYQTVVSAIELNLYAINQKRIHIENHICDQYIVEADRDMIEVVLRNLVSNAIKFSKSGGRIRLEARTENASSIRIIVTDEGVGIPQEIRKLLFVDYVSQRGTENEKGMGVGLMLCKDFIAMNGGRIFVDETYTLGARFNIIIAGERVLQQV